VAAAIVQSRHKYPGNSDTFVGNVVVGNVIVVLVAGSGNGTDLSSCTDNLGNTYTAVAAQLNSQTTGGRTATRCWVAPVTTGGACTVTVSNISDVGIVRMIEVSGDTSTVNTFYRQSSSADPTTYGLTNSVEASYFFLWANENGDRFTSFDGGVTLFGEDTGHADASGYALDVAASSPSYSCNLTASGDPISGHWVVVLENSGGAAGQPTMRRFGSILGQDLRNVSRPVEVGHEGVTVARRFERRGRISVPSFRLAGAA